MNNTLSLACMALLAIASGKFLSFLKFKSRVLLTLKIKILIHSSFTCKRANFGL